MFSPFNPFPTFCPFSLFDTYNDLTALFLNRGTRRSTIRHASLLAIASMAAATVMSSSAFAANSNSAHEALIPRSATNSEKVLSTSDYYPDVPRLLLNLESERPQRLSDLVAYIQFECELDYRVGLAQTMKSLEKLPSSRQSVCLLPALLEERERLAKLFKNENESPFEFDAEFNPIALRTGWWNLKPFQNSAIEPSKALLRWIIVNEALRRNIRETQDVFRHWFSRVTDQSNAITFPLIAAYFESPILIVRTQMFLELSRCERFQIACKEMRDQVLASYFTATTKAQERITTLLDVLDHPLPGTTVEEVEQLRSVREAARLLARIREQPGTSLELMTTKASLTTRLESYSAYRDSLFELGSIPKSLDDSSLAKALTASLLLTELEKQKARPITQAPPQRSAHGPLTQALIDELMQAAKSFEELFFSREVSL